MWSHISYPLFRARGTVPIRHNGCNHRVFIECAALFQAHCENIQNPSPSTTFPCSSTARHLSASPSNAKPTSKVFFADKPTKALPYALSRSFR